MITKAQQTELAKLARAANRRLERASEGQRAALEYNIRGYHTREGSRGTVFQQGAAKTEAEYRQRMSELKSFMKGETSKITDWKRIKRQNVESATKTLGNMGYDITDEELAAVLEELPRNASRADYYSALENVMAAKRKKGGSLSREEIKAAVRERRSDYQATLAAIKARR